MPDDERLLRSIIRFKLPYLRIIFTRVQTLRNTCPQPCCDGSVIATGVDAALRSAQHEQQERKTSWQHVFQARTHFVNDVAKHTVARTNRSIVRLRIQTGTHYRPSPCNETSERSTRAQRLAETRLYQCMRPRPCCLDVGPTQPVAKHLRDVSAMVIQSIRNWEWPKHTANGPHWTAGLYKTHCASKAIAMHTASSLAVCVHTMAMFPGPPISCIFALSLDTGNDKSSVDGRFHIRRVQGAP